MLATMEQIFEPSPSEHQDGSMDQRRGMDDDDV